MNIDTRIEAIRLLSDGRWHSGERLAQALGVSRAAVWKRLQGLTEWGLELQAVRGRGYRLAQPLELLDAAIIRRKLSQPTSEQLQSIEIFPVLDSTNRRLMEMSGDHGVRLCMAEFQSAGRGRQGRNWHSPFGANLYLSFSWSFHELPTQFAALGLVTGVAVADAFAAFGLQDHGLKWPNDILWQGRKLAGILIEHRGESGGPARAVVGLGLNVSMSSTQAQGIDQPWTTLNEALRDGNIEAPGRNELCAGLVDALLCALGDFTARGFAPFAERWASYDLAFGRQVGLDCGGQPVTGIARGIDQNGALLIEVAGVTKRFLSGDMSLRMIAPVRP